MSLATGKPKTFYLHFILSYDAIDKLKYDKDSQTIFILNRHFILQPIPEKGITDATST